MRAGYGAGSRTTPEENVTVGHPVRRFAVLALVAPLLGAPLACSSGSSDAKTDAGKSTTTAAGKGASSGGTGSATITIGADSWDFANVRCGFGEEGTGVPGAIVNAAATQNGLSLYVADDGGGDSYIELSDLNDPDDGLNWSTRGASDTPTVTVDGKRVTADAAFIDGSGATTDGSVEVNCG
jgi:hypothetical protein